MISVFYYSNSYPSIDKRKIFFFFFLPLCFLYDTRENTKNAGTPSGTNQSAPGTSVDNIDCAFFLLQMSNPV